MNLMTIIQGFGAGLVLVAIGVWAGWEWRWRKQIDDAYKHSQRRESYIAQLELALSDANDQCRSAYQIAERHGEKTNWPNFCAGLQNRSFDSTRSCIGLTTQAH